MKDERAIKIIAQVAKRQIEQKCGSVANAITEICSSNENEKYNKPCPYNPAVMCIQMPGDRQVDDYYCDNGCPNRRPK